MAENKFSIKNILVWLAKIFLTALAFYIVYRKIDKTNFIDILLNLRYWWLIPALYLFIISKIFSTIRLSGLLENIGVTIDHKTNLRLYFKGMFYNLFLPGGIGGDAFKTYVINSYKQAPVKKILGTILYDRISGMIILAFIACILGPVVLDKYSWVFFLSFILIIPLGYIFTRLFFPSHKRNFLMSQVYSAGVQFSQLAAVVCILKSMQIQLLDYLSYLFLFLLSSIASVIPFTIGGAGARELVFLYGEKIIPINAVQGITIGILFFMITAMVSLCGAFINMKPKH